MEDSWRKLWHLGCLPKEIPLVGITEESLKDRDIVLRKARLVRSFKKGQIGEKIRSNTSEG